MREFKRMTLKNKKIKGKTEAGSQETGCKADLAVCITNQQRRPLYCGGCSQRRA